MLSLVATEILKVWCEHRNRIGLACFLILYFVKNCQSATKKKNSRFELVADGVRIGSSIVPQTNLLFIMFDDLRPELSIYGKYHVTSPNFERLAKKAVVFDQAYCQVAVCNPSRDSLLTGLRPDTTGTYAFQTDWRPHLVLPTRLKRSGYKTMGFGKILHWDEADQETWDHHYQLFGDWYIYQNYEWDHMNSTLMPDKTRPETEFPDHVIATQAIQGLRNASASGDYFMVSIGFKMPHLSQHVPYAYYDMYRSRKHIWDTPDVERTFPPTAPVMSYRCCGDRFYRHMKEEGAKKSHSTIELESISDPIPQAVRTDLMWGYTAMITFVDKQLGRVLDAIDELQLWNNLTIVLTADHGMHNGEKGLWEKWSLFDESTRVPLMIYHPSSPFKGQRYKLPVELIDIFPTLHEILGAPYNRKTAYLGPEGASFIRKMVPLQGKSLARVILGQNFRYKVVTGPRLLDLPPAPMPRLNRTFALSQALKCAEYSVWDKDPRKDKSLDKRAKIWTDCDVNNLNYTHVVATMGYSMRTPYYRYTAWIPFYRPNILPLWDKPLLGEELYDHRNDHESSLGTRELVNLAVDQTSQSNQRLVKHFRKRLVGFLKAEAPRLYLNLSRPVYRKKTGLWGIFGFTEQVDPMEQQHDSSLEG